MAKSKSASRTPKRRRDSFLARIPGFKVTPSTPRQGSPTDHDGPSTYTFPSPAPSNATLQPESPTYLETTFPVEPQPSRSSAGTTGGSGTAVSSGTSCYFSRRTARSYSQQIPAWYLMPFKRLSGFLKGHHRLLARQCRTRRVSKRPQ